MEGRNGFLEVDTPQGYLIMPSLGHRKLKAKQEIEDDSQEVQKWQCLSSASSQNLRKKLVSDSLQIFTLSLEITSKQAWERFLDETALFCLCSPPGYLLWPGGSQGGFKHSEKRRKWSKGGQEWRMWRDKLSTRYPQRTWRDNECEKTRTEVTFGEFGNGRRCLG